MNSSPSLQTIADAAGVSRMTVSRALRNDPTISEKTRARILQVSKDLNYKPNPLVSALMNKLRSGRPHTSATVLAYLSTYSPASTFGRFFYIEQMRQGAYQRAAELGFRLEEFNLASLSITLTRFVQISRARGIRGILVAPLPQNRRLAMDFSPFAAAALGSSLLRPDLHRAQSHTIRNLSLALRHLRRLGFHRIGLVLDQLGENRAEHLLSALMLQFQSTRKDTAEKIPTLILPKVDRQPVMKWLYRYKPEVVIGFSFEIPWWLREIGPDCPKFVNLNWNEKDGSDFGINQEADRIAAAGVDLIVEQLYSNCSGVPSHPKIVMSPGRWVISTRTNDSPTGKETFKSF